MGRCFGRLGAQVAMFAWFVWAGTAGLAGGRACAQSVTPAFNYQGELRSDGVPATGPYDLRFRLYAAAAGGAQLGATVCRDNVQVTAGRFAVADLDFGPQFAGQRRWIEIEVRQDTGLSCASGEGYTTLAPRQELTATPYAIYALAAGTAGSATLLDGQAGSFYQNAANLTTGVIPSDRFAGEYTGALTFSNAGNAFAGDGAGLTGLNAGSFATGVVAPAFGGTGLDTSAADPGAMLYALGAGLWTVLPPGNEADVLTLSGGVPVWAPGGGGGGGLALPYAGTGSVAAPGATFAVTNNADGSAVFAQSTAPEGMAVRGISTATSGYSFGGFFEANSPEGRGVFAANMATTGLALGGRFGTQSSQGRAVYATAGSTTGSGVGVYGESHSSSGSGVFGSATSTTGSSYGVYGESFSASGRGVYGTGNVGIQGLSNQATGYGAVGWNFSPSGTATGVQGLSLGSSGRGVSGSAIATTGNAIGVLGQSAADGGAGVVGNGVAKGGSFESSGATGTGVYGDSGGASGGTGVYGVNSSTAGNTRGVIGTVASFTGIGVVGYASNTSGPGYGGYFSTDSASGVGLSGRANSTTNGTAYGVQGMTGTQFGAGVTGTGNAYGVLGTGFAASGFGVYSVGNIGASGAKSFRIDHPDDPENRYLLHYAAESPEVMNFYSGKAVLDGAGEAVVELPAYFAKINKDPRYALTAIGSPMPLLHVASEIDEAELAEGAKAGPGVAAPVCRFRIAGGAPGGKVSWEVKAVRNDRFMQARGAPVELPKAGAEVGTYQHPELYGQPVEKRSHQSVATDRGEQVRPRPAPAGAAGR